MFNSHYNAAMNAEKSVCVYQAFVMVVYKWLMVGLQMITNKNFAHLTHVSKQGAWQERLST